ncbi:MAG: hypothetical protein H0U99_04860 [Chthoniobacterales bacterium]|nr:hypothetical protein [Chthoniobacterales bacterium]
MAIAYWVVAWLVIQIATQLHGELSYCLQKHLSRELPAGNVNGFTVN